MPLQKHASSSPRTNESSTLTAASTQNAVVRTVASALLDKSLASASEATNHYPRRDDDLARRVMLWPSMDKRHRRRATLSWTHHGTQSKMNSTTLAFSIVFSPPTFAFLPGVPHHRQTSLPASRVASVSIDTFSHSFHTRAIGQWRQEGLA